MNLLLCLSATFSPIPLNQQINHTQRNLSKRVIDGDTAYLHEAPFVVQLIRMNQCFCTGSIIGPDTILTAAHCTLHNVDSIVYGTTFRFNPEEGFFKSVPIRRIHRHPTYEGGVQPNDIAIIELMESILPDRFAQAIDLDDKEVECNSPVASYGFGRTQRVQVEHRMQVMETKVRNNCERTMRFDQYVVTQIDDKTVCNGDSGGPLINQYGKQIGVLSGSRQTGCVVGDINYFVKVGTHFPFIKKYFMGRQQHRYGGHVGLMGSMRPYGPPPLSLLPPRLECTLLRNALRDKWSYEGEDAERIAFLYETRCFPLMGPIDAIAPCKYFC
ncbi:hypothetical protein BLOT_008142 [Blomia tropicalis]|nr:hypothetical protein BLOT_008142 [Blomia tropicalis]